MIHQATAQKFLSRTLNKASKVALQEEHESCETPKMPGQAIQMKRLRISYFPLKAFDSIGSTSLKNNTNQ